MNVFLDIETVPNQTGAALELFKVDAEGEKAAVKAPGNYKDPAKIEAYIAEKHAEIDAALHDKILKTAFDGALGHIAVIGVAFDNEAPITIYADGTEPHKHEAEVIAHFFDLVKNRYKPSRDTRPVFVGHNIVEFDLRFLFQRAVILGIKPPAVIPFAAKPWDDVVFDTMTRWAGARGSVKLDKLARALGLPGKTTMDGSQVWPAIAAGRIKEVATYCADDVVQTREVWRRMNFLPPAVVDDSTPFAV